MTTKLNPTKYKREVVEILLKHFIDSGVEYTCAAAVHGECNKLALELAKKAIQDGYCFSKTIYPFAEIGNTKDIFLTATERRYYTEIYLPSHKGLIMQTLTAETTMDLVQIMNHLNKVADASSWLVIRGDFGYSTILVYNSNGDLVAEISNKN
jgi:hypothetical protein